MRTKCGLVLLNQSKGGTIATLHVDELVTLRVQLEYNSHWLFLIDFPTQVKLE